MKPRLILYIVAFLLLVGGSFTAMADQSTKFVGPYEASPVVLDRSGRFVGVHELPRFVLERVELTPGVAAGPAGLGAPRTAG